MYQKSRLSTRIFVVITICVLTLSSGTYVFAQDNTADHGSYASNSAPELTSLQAPVAGGPGFYAISPVDFTPVMWSQGRTFTSATLVNPNQTGVSFVAPAHLPHGATISKMVVYFIDNANPNLDLQVWLYRCDLALGTCEGLIYGQSAHAYPDHQIYELFPVGNTLVDLQSSYYMIEVHIPASPLIGLTGIRIDYGYPVSLPVIMR